MVLHDPDRFAAVELDETGLGGDSSGAPAGEQKARPDASKHEIVVEM